MTKGLKSAKEIQLELENEELKAQLVESEELIDAIRNGKVDAIVVAGSEGESIYSLTSAETPYRILIEAMHEGAASLEADGTILYCNHSLSNLFSVPFELIIGANIRQFISENEKEKFDLFLKKGSYENDETEICLLEKNGLIRYLNISIAPIPKDIAGKICLIASDVSDRKHTEEQLKTSQEQLKKFTSHLLNIQEEEKILLATQLDNELSQILAALKMDIGMLKKKIFSQNLNVESEEILQKLNHAHNMVGISINTSVKFMSTLRNEVLYLVGFVEALKLYTSDFQLQYNIISEFESNISTLNLNRQMSTSLFRIFQSALLNIAIHSKATKMKVNLMLCEEKLTLKIWDNGIGFNPEKPFNPDANGLISMKERANLLNGELQIESLQNQGTSIWVKIPYTNT